MHSRGVKVIIITVVTAYQSEISYTVGPVLNAWFNDCVLRFLPNSEFND